MFLKNHHLCVSVEIKTWKIFFGGKICQQQSKNCQQEGTLKAMFLEIMELVL